MLSDKVALITGAGSGIGREVALLFAANGADVAVVDIDEHSAVETTSMINEADHSCRGISVQADVSSAKDVKAAIATTVDEFGCLDVLHNNAGLSQRDRCTVPELSETEWDDLQDVNLKGVFLGAKYAIQQMQQQQGGVILNTSSTSALRHRAGLGGYAAAKGGVITLTQQLAGEHACDDIRVNAICPVATETPMLRNDFSEKELEQLRATVPLGRLAQPEDIAQAAVFLASEKAAMITGVTLPVDGGRTIQLATLDGE